MTARALALVFALASPDHEIANSSNPVIVDSPRLQIASSPEPHPACPPADYPTERLRQLKLDKFALPSDDARRALAMALQACLGDPRPELRDGIAFEALSTWLRGGELDHATLRSLRDRLLPGLTADDAPGFRAPFSALVLAEIARTDRLGPWLSFDERDALVQAADAYLRSVTDYRAFSDTDGWRHGVAHGADFILQLALNAAVTKAQIDRLLASIATQVAPAAPVSYRTGEPDRLARAVFFIAQRRLHTATEWTSWFAGATSPAPLASWDAASRSELGLARRHNARAFLLSLFADARDSEETGVATMLAPLKAALRQIR